MELKNLHIINYKNYESFEFEAGKGINCFVGNNGVGKTNLLDAIYYLSFCKSFFNPIDRQNIRYDQEFFVLEGEYDLKDNHEKLYCGVKRGQKKKFKRNKKEYDRLADHIGHFVSVMVSPNDAELILGGSEVRRKFIDGIIAQFDKQYLDYLLNYNKALQQRNALLKYFQKERTWNEDNLKVWDDSLIKYGQYIHDQRKKFLEVFVPIFNERYSFISSSKESVEIEYSSQLKEGSFEEVLMAARDKDRMTAYSSAGVHKDDLVFKLNGYPVKKFGSQGQQKSFLISLKLGQFSFLAKSKGYLPILLLDDIFDKLDRLRITKLMELVSNNEFGQVFITDTNEDRVHEILKRHDVEYNLIGIG
ncbi:MAG: DNA replication and repair protein RecF [Parvicellaceae bacterium]|jgi:DNA replication and repair protein RecF